MLIGAAVAAFLVLPAVASDNGWITWPTKTYPSGALRVDDVIGNVRVNVQPGPMKLDISGNKDLVAGLTVKTEGNTLRISGSDAASINVWDWKKWFDFSHIRDDRGGKLFIKVTVPKGADVRVEDLVGDATIGDTYGPLRLETSAGDATVGRVTQARVSLAGSGKIAMSDVQNELRIEIAGSGRITAARVGSVRADIAGSGDAQVGAVAGGINVDIAGSGDFTARARQRPGARRHRGLRQCEDRRRPRRSASYRHHRRRRLLLRRPRGRSADFGDGVGQCPHQGLSRQPVE
ncbi:MAG: DUF2807 domain-containing protein [Rhizomicrobium sp.]